MKRIRADLIFKPYRDGWKCLLAKDEFFDIIDTFKFVGPIGTHIRMCQSDGRIINEWKQTVSPMYTAPFMGQDFPLGAVQIGLEPYLMCKVFISGTASCRLIGNEYMDYLKRRSHVRYNDVGESFIINNGTITPASTSVLDNSAIQGDTCCCCCLCQ